MFPSILHVFYGILPLFYITFDALQMRLIVTDVVVTITHSHANIRHKIPHSAFYPPLLTNFPHFSFRILLYALRISAFYQQPLEDDLLEVKYTNQCIRQTCAHLLLFNTNVPLFVKKMTLKSQTTQQTTHHIRHETVESIH